VGFATRLIELAKANVEAGGRPFACLIVRAGEVIAEGTNQAVQTHDPTAHAEIVAIRKAAAILKSENFSPCEFYLMSHPCPMCLGAMYHCSPDRVIFLMAPERSLHWYCDKRRYFTSADLYAEYGKPWQERRMPMILEPDPRAEAVFQHWKELHP
jgi:guanine deaminase